ncbi:hypothetical protein QYE76_008822 [Lolium multiflorum]|uniref:Uncharacterized protein n=1 Tax=Lolium multiflorum TaxID=4521 RepID=A0AAD8TQT0_LOLMU|nr:hypothetical protein QYE76_008822 [Lolium multiflorum]
MRTTAEPAPGTEAATAPPTPPWLPAKGIRPRPSSHAARLPPPAPHHVPWSAATETLSSPLSFDGRGAATAAGADSSGGLWGGGLRGGCAGEGRSSAAAREGGGRGDLAAHNYYHWRHLFDVHLGRCNLRFHVTDDARPQLHDPQWVKDDLAIIQWIYMRVSTEIFNLVHRDGASAADLWTALRQLFQDNVDARANNLHTKLRNMVQGDTPVGVYCQRLKAIADELHELGDPIDDRRFINVLVVSLSEWFEKQASFIPMMRPCPSFAEVRSMLQWANRAQTNKDSCPQVFTTAPRPPVPPLPPPSPPMAPPQPSGWRPSPNYRGRNPKPPQFRTAPAPNPPSAPPPAPPTAPPPPPGWHPSPDLWNGLVQAWPMPWSAPTPYGAPPAYTGGWQPGARPDTGAPILAPRQATAAYHAAPAYNAPPYASHGATSSPTCCSTIYRSTMMVPYLYADAGPTADATTPASSHVYTSLYFDSELGPSCYSTSHEQLCYTRKLRYGLDFRYWCF